MDTARRRRRRPPRLVSEAYEWGAAHVIVCCVGGQDPFRNRQLAASVFEPWASHPATLAACLMPDHLHRLARPTPRLPLEVARLKSWTTRVAWRGGWRSRLWQRSFMDRVTRRRDDPRLLADYVIGNPVRAGLVAVGPGYRNRSG